MRETYKGFYSSLFVLDYFGPEESWGADREHMDLWGIWQITNLRGYAEKHNHQVFQFVFGTF